MRLICPNCDAQYEVDDAVIPEDGREVQCSNCGHTWFQRPVGAEAPAATAEPEPAPAETAEPEPAPADEPEADSPPEPDVPPELEPEDVARTRVGRAPGSESTETAPEPTPEDPDLGEAERTGDSETAPAHEEEDRTGPASQPDGSRRELDAAVMNILKEEAEREQRAREQEAAAETFAGQPDLGLDSAAPAPAPRERAAEPPEPEPTADGAEAESSRRDLLPDIEEINSSLAASSDRGEDSIVTAEAEEAEQRSAFRLGFALVVLVAALAVAIYVLAPEIAGLHPALEAPMRGYVEAVDGVRIWLNSKMPQAVDGAVQMPEGDAN